MPSIDRDALHTYLNDHLAGSVGALELMDRLCAAHPDGRLGNLLCALKAEVEKEQTILRDLLAEVGGRENPVSKAIAWLGEKASRIKLGPDPDNSSGLKLFESLEALSLGFWGRRSLWWTLARLAREAPLLHAVDFAGLAARAERQLDELEELRMHAAMAALKEAGDGALAANDAMQAQRGNSTIPT